MKSNDAIYKSVDRFWPSNFQSRLQQVNVKCLTLNELQSILIDDGKRLLEQTGSSLDGNVVKFKIFALVML